MIGTQIMKGQGMGNRLFCYVTARAVAADRGQNLEYPEKRYCCRG